MGKVRSERVKRFARELINQFPERFTDDFDSNKKAVEALTNVSSKKLRNRVAGYITHLINIAKGSEEWLREQDSHEERAASGNES